jgi:hypothetical protein
MEPVAPPPPSFYRRDWQYRCETCGATLMARTADVQRHLSDGWPVCCRQVMLLTPLPLDDEPG